MPDKETRERAEADRRSGKSASTQAGEFVREEMHHVREGKHGARSAEQAIAIGLSKARRSGVALPPPKRGRTSEATREHAQRDVAKGRRAKSARPSRRRSRAVSKALGHERRSSASSGALAKHAKSAAGRRSPKARSAQAKRAARTRRKHA
jgi:hypothetical protein